MVSDAKPSISGAPGSLRIVDQSTGTRLAVGQAVLTALVVGFFVAAFTGSPILAFVLFVGIVVLGFFVIPRTIEASKWRPAELHVSTSPLALGSVTIVEYVRASKKPTGVDRLESVSVELTCTESATYTVGTDTRTDTNNVYEHRQVADGAFVAGTYSAQFSIQIPVERGAPTMDLGNNEVSWKIEVSGGKGALPSRTIGFTLTVIPTLAVPESLDVEIQDA